MMRTFKPLLCAAVLVASVRTELQAQQTAAARAPTRVPVTVALVDTLAGDAPFRILRRATVAPYDVILLRANADSAALSAAVQDLISIRQVQGDTARAAAGVVRVRRPSATPGQRMRMLPWARRVIDDLRRAERQAVAGVGSVPAVQIWLPPQRGRRPAP